MTEAHGETSLDLNAYLERIGYHGARTPSLETLAAIVERHTATIPFENLSPFLRQPVPLDLASLQEKLIHSGRGGYCFEQNFLMRAALGALGFQVAGLAARVRWGVPDEVITPRSHMLLRVEVEGRSFLADAGFGGITLTAPLALIADIEQPTSHEPFRLIGSGAGYSMQALIGGQWKALYTFDLQEQHAPDYQVSNWYISNHPDSYFVTSLIAARPDAGRRYALHNNQLAIHSLEGHTERRALGSAAELREALEHLFLIRLPKGPGLIEALGRAIGRGG